MKKRSGIVTLFIILLLSTVMADSFRKTFIVEKRYKLFLKDIAATLVINILSLILGTLLGFAMYLACRKGNPLANKVTSFFVWLIRGMPAVVLLMLLYYVIFGRDRFPAI